MFFPSFWAGASKQYLSATFVLSFYSLQNDVSHDKVASEVLDINPRFMIVNSIQG